MAGEINFGAVDQNAPYEGAAKTNALLESFARLRAGRALAAGNPQGAMDTLNNEGMIDDAQKVHERQWQDQEHIRTMAVEKQAEAAKFVAEVTSSLWQVKQAHKADQDGGTAAVLSGFDQLTPILKMRGRSDEEIATLRNGLTQNTDQFLQLMHDNAVKHYVSLNGGTGGPQTLINADTGETIATGAPAGPQYKTVKDADGAEHLIEVTAPAQGGVPSAPVSPTPATASPAAPGAGVEPVAATPDQAATDQSVAPAGGTPAPATAPTPAPVDPNASPWAVPTKTVASILGVPVSVSAHGYKRTPAENAKAGGVKNSEHLYGHALDFVPQGMSMGAAMDKIVESGVPFNQLINEGNHIHISWGDALKGEILEGNPAMGRPYRRLGYAGRQVGAASPTPTTGEVNPASVTPAANPAGVRELFSGAHNKAVKPTPQYEVRTGGPFAPGTVYKVETHSGDTHVLQAPPKVAKGANAHLSTNEEKTLYDLRKSVNERRNVAGLIDEFVGYLSGPNKVVTGGSMGLPGVATAMGPFNTKIGRMRSIIAQLTPVMRNGLPGAASDRDVAMFRTATVGFEKTPEANVAIARAAQATLKREGDYVAFLEAYGNAHGTLRGAQDIWSAYADANPIFGRDASGNIRVNRAKPWREAIRIDNEATASQPSAPAPTGGPRIRTWSPDKGFH